MSEVFRGIKNIQIHATTRYPIISAYEFEFLKTEDEVQALLKPCTIYFILQRPLLYINNLYSVNGSIHFDIQDDVSNTRLRCTFSPAENGFSAPTEDLLIELQYYKRVPDKEPPYSDIAVFKLRRADEEFLGWFSPAKFLYEYLSGSLKAHVDGPILDYIDYTVHYIGKAFSQDIWNRLTGHHKMQKILTLEDSLNKKALKAPFEISLLMLDIDGFNEANVFPLTDATPFANYEAIFHEFTEEDNDDRFVKYYDPHLTSRAEELTTEVEALLVSTFKPKHNEILFTNYPYISSGTRSAGYTDATLLIERLPVRLKTEHHVQECVPSRFA